MEITVVVRLQEIKLPVHLPIQYNTMAEFWTYKVRSKMLKTRLIIESCLKHAASKD